MTAKEMIEDYNQRYAKHSTVKILVVQKGAIAKIKNFCYNFLKKMREKNKFSS